MPVATVTGGGELEVPVIGSSVQSGDRVAFKLREAICPDWQQILTQLTPDVELTGRVVFFSDSGANEKHFAIVDVRGLLSPIIVPASRLRPAVSEASSHAATA